MAEVEIKSMNEEINKILDDIEIVNDLKQHEIRSIEEEKQEIKEVTRHSFGKTEREMRKEIDDFVKNHKHLGEQIDVIGQTYHDPPSLTMLDHLIQQLDKNISRLESERVNTINELEKKQRDLMRELESIEKIDLLKNALTYKIYEMQHSHRKKIDTLHHELNALKARTDLNESEFAVEIEILEKRINDVTATHEDVVKSLEIQKLELVNESKMKMGNITSVLNLINSQRQQLINEYEQQMQNASETTIDLIRNKIERLKAQMAEESKLLKNSEESLLSLLEDKGLRLTPSGRFLTNSGQLFTYDEADQKGLLIGISRTQMEQIFKCYTPTSKTSTNETTSSSTSWSNDMAPEDVHYLKKTIAVPLVLALAEVTAKQPRDPIHYLAHWLIKYRYNQEIDDIKKAELKALLAERERLAAEKRHRQLEEEARACIWEMILRAEQEALRREMEAELLRIALEAEMMEEEFNTNEYLEQQALDEEARDILGVYNGPVVNRRTWDQH